MEPISKKDLQARATAEGLQLEILPAKMVYTRKAGVGLRRARAVVCGNFQQDQQQELYAGGLDGTQIRAILQVGASRNWSAATSDIRVAFLNAPRRRDKKLVAMEVPSVFRRLGLCHPEHHFLVDSSGDVWVDDITT